MIRKTLPLSREEMRTRSVAEEGLFYPPPEGANLIKTFIIRFQGEDYEMKKLYHLTAKK